MFLRRISIGHNCSGFRSVSIWISPTEIFYAESPSIATPSVSHSTAATAATAAASSTTKYYIFIWRDGCPKASGAFEQSKGLSVKCILRYYSQCGAFTAEHVFICAANGDRYADEGTSDVLFMLYAYNCPYFYCGFMHVASCLVSFLLCLPIGSYHNTNTEFWSLISHSF